jgi:hypothetical protein
MKDTTDGKTRTMEFSSVADLAESADRCALDRVRDPERCERFAGVTFKESLRMAREGWTDELASAMEIAESAVSMAQQEHAMDSFNEPVWDVTGAQVDVGAFLAGTPECMIDYPLTTTSKVGRVITLVVSTSFSSILSLDTLVRRGRVITAFALALARMGHAVEIWADSTPVDPGNEGRRLIQRVLVKGVDDELDPGVLMFALGHPSFLRNLLIGARGKLKSPWQAFPQTGGYPTPRPSGYVAQYPEGTIFLPELKSDSDVPNADEFLRKYLGELGLLAE